MNNPTFGLVLSGGGVRGMAHVGVIKALEENGIHPTTVSGASAGALVGAFYAAGYPCDEILKFFKTTSLFSINNYAYRKPGLLDTEKFYKILLKRFPKDSFEALEKQLYVSTTDIVAGKNKIFHQGQLIHAVLASAAFPVVLSPVSIEGTLYADGGITNNFPVEPLLGQCDTIIGIYSNPLKKIKPNELKTSISILDRAFEIGMDSRSTSKFKYCDMVISPEKLNQLGTFSMSSLDEAYQIGYETAQAKLGDILALKQ